ncbi:hypothetical protein [Actinomadura violacea]|uniref:DUF3040 domain-containing protein n=1 Tax=Actinomadura violacea TaxID=2819934 RepID=A0ABS3RWZ6_9ACTN|nr:hypothetical protein [Actinomadura violacea]MBO2460983.1 hypothetical protein [Actinomadura violacea]
MTPESPSTNDRLVRIEIKLDQALTQHADHETRIRLLERGRWPLPSVAVLLSVGALAAAVIPLVSH